MTRTLTEPERSRFEEAGYVILDRLLDEAIVERAREEVSGLVDREAEKLLREGLVADPLEDEPFETRIWKLYRECPDEAPPSFRAELHLAGLYDCFFDDGLLDVVEELLGPEVRLYPNYTCRPKYPELAKAEVNWHQDGAYTAESDDVEELRMVNAWSPLVPARVENGCMEFVPGTQEVGVVPHEQREHYLEIAPDHLEPRLGEATPIELDPGDVVLFDNLRFHRGRPNTTDHVRWSLDWRYQDATQPTMRERDGHVARSRSDPESAVGSPEEWASLSFR